MLPSLTRAHWPASGYARDALPERVLQFGSGMLLRALCDTAIDAAQAGRIVVTHSTAEGAVRAQALNAQDGLFTLVERGSSGEHIRLIGAISRAVTDVAVNATIQVIISNVSEAGFRIDAPFPARLTEVLHARFKGASQAGPLFVIPTELVPDNGPRLAEMVHALAKNYEQAFGDWLNARVRFCSSLVDRIVTAPAPAEHAKLEQQLGYRDALLTIAEPYALWAIEADPAELRAAFPIESSSVVFAPDIAFYRERKLRLLNAVHTATAPLALLAGIRTVREGSAHPLLAPFMKRLLFEEIIPATDLPRSDAHAFAHQVLERFANPWLEHEYRVIATNQEEKFRIRVAPLIARSPRAPCLALAAAANLAFSRAPGEASALWTERLAETLRCS